MMAYPTPEQAVPWRLGTSLDHEGLAPVPVYTDRGKTLPLEAVMASMQFHDSSGRGGHLLRIEHQPVGSAMHHGQSGVIFHCAR